MTHPRRILHHVCKGVFGILHYNRQVVPSVTARRASRGRINDCLNFELIFPGRLLGGLT